MSIIAYRAGILAADRLSVVNGMAFEYEKLRSENCKFAGKSQILALATTGPNDSGEAMRDWFRCGQSGDFPKCQESDASWARLIVLFRRGIKVPFEPGILVYERTPVPMEIYSEYMAWGLGAEYAMAAMHTGQGAIPAVQVANKFSIYCGGGVTWFGITERGALEGGGEDA